MKREVIEETVATWTREPEKARSTPTVTARLDEGQALIEAGPFTWRADLPGPLGGTNRAPSPTALLLGALAGCAVAFVHDTLAPQLGIEVTAVNATARCETDARGLLGIDDADPALQNVAVDVTVESPGGDEAVAELARVWEERCPIYLALQKPNDVALTFRATS